MEYLIKLGGQSRDIYLKMPGTVTDEEWKKRLAAADKKYQAMRIDDRPKAKRRCEKLS